MSPSIDDYYSIDVSVCDWIKCYGTFCVLKFALIAVSVSFFQCFDAVGCRSKSLASVILEVHL